MNRPSRLLRPLRRARLGLRRLAGRTRARVIYHEEYDAVAPGVPLDPLRAAHILAFLGREGLLGRHAVRRSRPASLKSLERVHDAGYLDRVHDPETLERIFAHPVADDRVDRLLDHQRLLTGGTKLATHLALRDRSVAINLGGGLHHAHADHGAGFCIFNDVAIAVAEARTRGFAGRVLVVDLDLHDGDGTRAIFRHDATVHTCSVHARTWDDDADDADDAVASTSVALGDDVGDDVYLGALRETLPPLFAAPAPELVIYLAGTDVAHDDRLGDWRITAAGMLERDRLVLELARGGEHPLPLVILLAGGYGTASWRYSARFLSLVFDGRGAIEPPPTETINLERYRHLAALLDPRELSGGASDGLGLTEEDLFLPGWGMARETRFLGYYSKHGIELVLERGGFFDRLRALGFEHPVLGLELDDESGHTVRVWGDAGREELLVELTAARDRRTIPGLELLSIGWLLLQNPRAAFDPGRPRLPGQTYPGLGLAHDVLALLILVCDRLHLDGIVWVPSHLHTAFPWRERLVPVDPAAATLWRALTERFEDVPLTDVVRALDTGEIVDETTGEPIRWRPAPMVLPLSEKAHVWAEQARARALDPPHLRWRRDPAG